MTGYVVFSADFLAQVRSQFPLHQVISSEVTLRRSGKDHLGCCPFHEERSASFRVYSDRNTYRCFGCGESGDIIDWLRRRHDLSFHDAVTRAATLAGVPIPAQSNRSEIAADRARRAKLYEALTQAQRLYRRGLDRDETAISYLRSVRGLTDNTIEKFGLGVVGKGVIDLIRGTVSPHVLIESGLTVKNDRGESYDRFRNRIIFPIANESGTLVGFAGRSLRDDGKAPKYLNSPETEIFQKRRELYGLYHAKAAIRRSRVAVVVEGYFDVLSLHQAGEERAVAPMGTALTAIQVRRLLTHTDRLVLAFDGDKAGCRASLNAVNVFLEETKDSTTAAVLVLPDGEDPDSYVRTRGATCWQSAVSNAKPLSEFLCDIIRRDLDRTLPESQVRAAETAVAFLERIKYAPMFRRALRQKFEDVIGISLELPASKPGAVEMQCMEEPCLKPMR